MKYFVISLILIGFTTQAFASESFYGTSSFENAPSELTTGKSTKFEIKFQYTDGPYALSNFSPVINVSPASASSMVHLDVKSPEEISQGQITRIPVTITVNPDIDHEKIFLSISFTGDHFSSRSDVFYKSAWTDSISFDIAPKDQVGTLVDPTLTGSYELSEALCLGGPGMIMDENCQRVRPSPYSQQKDGIDPEQVRCNRDLYRNYKISDGSAFCASGYALRELIHRGYAQGFDALISAAINRPNSIVNEYCPTSQELLQSGWYAYKNPPSVINTNIDLIYDPTEDSQGVEFTFDPINPETNDKSMLWVFVECDDRFDTFEVIIRPETIEHRKNFVVYYPSSPDTTIHFDNQDIISYQIDGVSDNGKNSFTIMIDPQDAWIINEPPNTYEGTKYIELSASNPDTGEVYDWMNYIIYITEDGDRK